MSEETYQVILSVIPIVIGTLFIVFSSYYKYIWCKKATTLGDYCTRRGDKSTSFSVLILSLIGLSLLFYGVLFTYSSLYRTGCLLICSILELLLVVLIRRKDLSLKDTLLCNGIYEGVVNMLQQSSEVGDLEALKVLPFVSKITSGELMAILGSVEFIFKDGLVIHIDNKDD